MIENESGDNQNQFVEHKTEVNELKELLKETLNKYPAYNTDYSLLRWLFAHNYNVDLTATRMRWALNVIDKLGAFDNLFEDAYEYNNFLFSRIPAAEYMPGGLMGTDKSGNIICMHPIGLCKPRDLMRIGRVTDFYRAVVMECEASLRLLRREENNRRRKLNVILVFDVAGFSMDTFYMPSIKVYLDSLELLQRLFPESIGKIFIINTPTIVVKLFQLAKQVLSAGVLKKVNFLHNDWQSVLKEMLGEENIFRHWGGTKKSPIPTGCIRMGGEVPKEICEKLRKSVKIVPESLLTKICVPSGSNHIIEVEVLEKNSKLSWYFVVSSDDILFRIIHGEEEVWPSLRIFTQFVAEYGEMICSNVGKYYLHFDNSYSRLRKKEIAYCIEVFKD